MNKAIQYTEDFLRDIGCDLSWIQPMSAIFLTLLSILASVILYCLFRYAIQPVILSITDRDETEWDHYIFHRDVLKWIWIIVAVVVADYTITSSLVLYPNLRDIAVLALDIVLIYTIAMVLIAMVKKVTRFITRKKAVNYFQVENKKYFEEEEDTEIQEPHTLKGFEQMFTLVIIIGAVILSISLFVGKNPLIIISGLSAGAAVLILIFKDSILGVVAGIQLTANNMLQPGDWITMSKYGINGRVQSVSLGTVKVKNWDKTIITVPPYNLVSDAFQNWRGIYESGGRRVMRSVNIDMNSISFAKKELIMRWKDEQWWDDIKTETPTNVDLYRAYLEDYIQNLSTFVGKLEYMVREQQSTGYGLPIEIYFFTSETGFRSFEHVQSEVIDHAIAMLPKFELRPFQLFNGNINTIEK